MNADRTDTTRDYENDLAMLRSQLLQRTLYLEMIRRYAERAAWGKWRHKVAAMVDEGLLS